MCLPFVEVEERKVIRIILWLLREIILCKYTSSLVTKTNFFIIFHLNFCLLHWGLFFKDFIYLFLERGKEGEKHQCVVTSQTPSYGDLACNPGICPDLESNQQLFVSQAGIQSTEPHHPGPWGLLITFHWAFGFFLSCKQLLSNHPNPLSNLRSNFASGLSKP